MIFTWIMAIVVMIAGIGVAAYFAVAVDGTSARVAGILISVLLAVAIAGGCLFWLYGSESGKRTVKTFQSNYGGGIERTVTVYDVHGEVIKEYTGQFDTTHDSSRILFDDEYGKRHVIYYTTGTVVIDEL